MSVANRLQRLRGELQAHQMDAILVSNPENRRYLSGFTGSAGYLVITQVDAVLATDSRYIEQAGKQAAGFRIERISGGPGWLPTVATQLGVRRLGFESENLTVAAHSAFKKAIGEADDSGTPELVSTVGLAERLRASKDDEEMALLARAVEIADAALDQVAPAIEPGVTERDVAWELEKGMRERGADGLAFPTIVGAGPNGALPHHLAGERAIGRGEPIVIDMGASYRGYCSDLTRTIVVGEPDDTFHRVYDTVLNAQIRAEEAVREGMTGKEADAIARDVIVEAGYGESFGHSLGHGVGLAVHEYPSLGQRSEDRLEDGMAFTIEPGIYVPGWGGVRIEDIVVLENGKARVMSKARKLESAGL